MGKIGCFVKVFKNLAGFQGGALNRPRTGETSLRRFFGTGRVPEYEGRECLGVPPSFALTVSKKVTDRIISCTLMHKGTTIGHTFD